MTTTRKSLSNSALTFRSRSPALRANTSQVAVSGTMAALLLLAACSVGTPSEPSNASASDAEAVAGAEAAADSGASGAGSTATSRSALSAGGAAPAASSLAPAIVSTARIEAQSSQVGELRTEVLSLVAQADGNVTKDDTARDDDDSVAYSRLTLQVPSAKFSAVLDDIQALAPGIDVTRTDKDVTQQVVDVDSRLTTQQISLDRLRGFLDQASDVKTILSVEREIASREADVASLRGQQRSLRSRTAMSTVSVFLDRDNSGSAQSSTSRGFMAGLTQGWSAFTTTALVALTAAGASLPFLTALAVLLGVGVVVRAKLPAISQRREADRARGSAARPLPTERLLTPSEVSNKPPTARRASEGHGE